ncbi:hypothetical protein P3H15_48890, partial [Rhodococcus sp. T2V]|uniref:hypothetical protein n=1 Tax=Rhodococcus sp. T2V TaxID=3034164 RepID=UPI0023E091F9
MRTAHLELEPLPILRDTPAGDRGPDARTSDANSIDSADMFRSEQFHEMTGQPHHRLGATTDIRHHAHRILRRRQAHTDSSSVDGSDEPGQSDSAPTTPPPRP